jgi:hypothetical protein
MRKLEKFTTVDGEEYLLKLTFDIDDFIGDGIFNLEVYNDKGEMEVRSPFASSIGLPQKWWIDARKVLKNM